MEQLLPHVAGDYILQSDWMAMNKSKRSWPCFVHVVIYTSVFLFLTTSWKALLVIGAVHFVLDRWHFIIRRMIWAKNHMGPNFKFVPFSLCNVTGYYDNFANKIVNKPYTDEVINGYAPRLNYITIWLYIITDNFLHLLTNYLAIKYLG